MASLTAFVALLGDGQSSVDDELLLGFVGDHCRGTDSVCVTTKRHMTYCPLGKGDFDQLVVAGDLIFVASSKKPAAVQVIRFFESSR